jgi:hypothetical protein
LIKVFLMASQLFFLSCSSYEQFAKLNKEVEVPNALFNADFNQVWTATVTVMKEYEIETQNQDAGIIKTRWTDNTIEMNFQDAFGSSDRIKSAKFKLAVAVNKGGTEKRPQIKVFIIKKQMVEQDVFQGWKEIDNDYILEKILLYRIQRTLNIDRILTAKQKKIDAESSEKFNESSIDANQLPSNSPDLPLGGTDETTEEMTE